ncbi:MAG: hypothetical protein J1F64_08340 [Oscillospiraceae bacterium]|nr:hypothetical protein [Oscillospiraceae bacterium]
MRKSQVKQMRDMVEILYEAAGEIKKSLEKKNIEAAQTLLCDSQDAAIQMGEFIEDIEGEECVTIGYLEEFCNELVNIYNSLDEIPANKVHKLLHRSVLRIENSIENDIKVIKEIVFLPYKASMWDSLESIWKAADEDPNCNAIVIPIPYFERNSDMTLGTPHYEGSEFPEYVPVTDWRKYDLKEQRPDVIYIHNPYDDCNRVTCVLSTFFSDKLVNYTDMLVYVPYFVLYEPNPDNEKHVEDIKHFCITPGVINADKVIVQSENMRKVYIKNLLEYFGDTPENRKMLKEKVLGPGSPKFDKAVNTTTDDVVIPDEWLKIIQKPDGSRKKIVFYNTSVGAFLQNSDKYFDKMRYVFSVFKESDDDVALLWRPHPLMESTIKSMRKGLYEEYMALVAEYKAAGWGIYDDTSDLDRAIAISDAYYGDHSSVEQLCRKVGMPVMIQNCEITGVNDNV